MVCVRVSTEHASTPSVILAAHLQTRKGAFPHVNVFYKTFLKIKFKRRFNDTFWNVVRQDQMCAG